MFTGNTCLDYALLLLMSTGRKSFAALGRTINKRGEAISKLLFPADFYKKSMQKIALETFKNKKKLFAMIDETLLNKMYSQWMQGTARFYDSKLKISYTAYKLIMVTVSDGIYTLPLEGEFLFDPELCTEPVASRADFVYRVISAVQKLFPDKRIIFLLDGAFATKTYLQWCREHGIETEVRMPKNRVVEYRGKRRAIHTIKALRPKGRQMSRTILVKWYGIPLYITAERRIDKKGQHSVVFQAATYKAKSAEHVAHYNARWGIEKNIRTCKESCGIGDCYSISLQTQLNHMHAALLAFAIAQIECKKHNFINPEQALRSINRKNWGVLKHHLIRRFQLDTVAMA